MSKIKPAKEHINFKRGVDYIGVTVNFLVHDGNGRILLQKRSQQCRDEQGRWDIGGGAVEFGESLDDAVLRELREELNVTPIKYEFVQHYDAHRMNEGVPTHWIAITYAVHVNPDEVQINEPYKIDEIGWFTLDTLPEPRHSMFHKAQEIAVHKNILK